MGGLSDTALRIYLLLIREGRPMSIREVQRALGLSSPGQVHHHLERLRGLGLVVRTPEGYKAVRKNGVVEGAVILWSNVVPRSAFYLGFSAAFALAYAVVVALGLMALDPAAVAAIASLLTFSAVEFKHQLAKLRALLGEASNGWNA